MWRFLLLGLFVFASFGFLNKEYHREYHNNGALKAQGWKFYYPDGKIMEQGHYKSNQRVGYWYFYAEDGLLEKEGHYRHGKMVKWWLFYDEHGKINHKCQLQKGIKNGYCLKYKNEKLTSAQKYSNGKKIKEWYDFSSFKKENKLSDLK